MYVVDPSQAVAALSEALNRAAEQRVAAERLLERARELEKRLSADAEQARIASEHAQFAQLREAVTAAEAAERGAEERAQACSSALSERVEERERAELRKRELERALEENAAITEDAVRAEHAARDEAATADELLREHRAAREKLDAECSAAQAQLTPFNGEMPSLEGIDLLRELEAQTQFSEAARRIAERRAADSARRVSR